MKVFCPDCDKAQEAIVEDASFSHEFGTEILFDYRCVRCDRCLLTRNSRPKPEFDGPD